MSVLLLSLMLLSVVGKRTASPIVRGGGGETAVFTRAHTHKQTHTHPPLSLHQVDPCVWAGYMCVVTATPQDAGSGPSKGPFSPLSQTRGPANLVAAPTQRKGLSFKVTYLWISMTLCQRMMCLYDLLLYLFIFEPFDLTGRLLWLHVVLSPTGILLWLSGTRV